MTNQLSLFDFDFSLSADGQIAKEINDLFTIDEILNNWDIKGRYWQQDVNIVASWFSGYGGFGCGGLSDIRKEIENILKTKTYIYGEKGKYIYYFAIKYDDGTYNYRLIFETNKDIIGVNYRIEDINKIILGEETIHYPAMCIDIYNKDGTIKQDCVYGNKEKDTRYQILIGEWEVHKYSKNRLDPKKQVDDFYQAEFKLEDLLNYFKNKE